MISAQACAQTALASRTLAAAHYVAGSSKKALALLSHDEAVRTFELGRTVLHPTAVLNVFRPSVSANDDKPSSSPEKTTQTKAETIETRPARVGFSNRVQYEGERLLRWTSNLLGTAKEEETSREEDELIATARRSGVDDVVVRLGPACWSAPVLRELRRDAGAGDHVPPRPVPWGQCQGEVRIEIYEDKTQAQEDDDDDDESVYSRILDLAEGRRRLDKDDDALGLAPDPNLGHLVGVAVLPLRGVSQRTTRSMLDVRSTSDVRLGVIEVAAKLEPTTSPRVASLFRANEIDDLEAKLEVPDKRSRAFAQRCKDAVHGIPLDVPPQQHDDDAGPGPQEIDAEAEPTPPTPKRVTSTDRESESGQRKRFGDGFLFGRLRRARQSAVEMQNELHDVVRCLEQVRALIEWASPRSTLQVVGMLGLGLYFAATVRADVFGIVGVLAAFGPGLLDRWARIRATSLDEAAFLALAAGEEDNDAAAIVNRALLRAANCARFERGAAARRRVATTAPPAPKPAMWKSALTSILESLPSEADLDGVFLERRRAADFRRERRAVARNLGAHWCGPLWRRSVAWRRHFAAVLDHRLCFWYSARDALAGITPVLVVTLRRAALLDDDSPVLILHAAVDTAPDKIREWRLAAAHFRDARKLRDEIIRQASSDHPPDLDRIAHAYKPSP